MLYAICLIITPVLVINARMMSTIVSHANKREERCNKNPLIMSHNQIDDPAHTTVCWDDIIIKIDL